jgi:hypothetical protein
VSSTPEQNPYSKLSQDGVQAIAYCKLAYCQVLVKTSQAITKPKARPM